MPGVDQLERTLNPIWGENIIYFNYYGKRIVVVSAKGASIAANAVERVRRTGGRCLVFIGTCGSTDEAITDLPRQDSIYTQYYDLHSTICDAIL